VLRDLVACMSRRAAIIYPELQRELSTRPAALKSFQPS
jgi:hypothetical protein